jgi:transcriptional regulator with XRE-family HTH domain
MPEDETEEAALFESRVGIQLHEARESQGITLEEIAKSTRISIRYLENLETGDYSNLPAPTYSTGFVKAFARAVGLDEQEIGNAFRAEINYRPRSEGPSDLFEPTDPARIPPRGLAWIAAAIAVVLIIGYAVWRSGAFGMDADDRARLAAGTEPQEIVNTPAGSGGSAASATAAPASVPTGTVVLVANDVVWLRISELESGDRIFEAELQPGDRYEVPATARQPVIRTGRPEGLRVTVGGQAVAPLGDADTVVNDVSLLPADLVRRRPARAAARPQQ